ncbi:MAG: hypothetical protein ACK4KW_05090 [Gemmobacter sp.]
MNRVAIGTRFAAAFAVGIAVAAGVGWMLAVSTLRLPGTTIPMAYLAGPLAGLAAFQLAFGATSGRWRGWRFWAVALPLTLASTGAALAFALARAVPMLPALAVAGAVLFAFGLWAACGQTGARR